MINELKIKRKKYFLNMYELIQPRKYVICMMKSIGFWLQAIHNLTLHPIFGESKCHYNQSSLVVFQYAFKKIQKIGKCYVIW